MTWVLVPGTDNEYYTDCGRLTGRLIGIEPEFWHAEIGMARPNETFDLHREADFVTLGTARRWCEEWLEQHNNEQLAN